MYAPDRMSPPLKRLVTSPGYGDTGPIIQRRFRYFYKPISQHWSYKKVTGLAAGCRFVRVRSSRL